MVTTRRAGAATTANSTEDRFVFADFKLIGALAELPPEIGLLLALESEAYGDDLALRADVLAHVERSVTLRGAAGGGTGGGTGGIARELLRPAIRALFAGALVGGLVVRAASLSA